MGFSFHLARGKLVVRARQTGWGGFRGPKRTGGTQSATTDMWDTEDGVFSPPGWIDITVIHVLFIWHIIYLSGSKPNTQILSVDFNFLSVSVLLNNSICFMCYCFGVLFSHVFWHITLLLMQVQMRRRGSHLQDPPRRLWSPRPSRLQTPLCLRSRLSQWKRSRKLNRMRVQGSLSSL